ncbi:hypothetical protein DN051_01335 [Streptomyces cadmiisoli]|uniref:Uncharacterized protein n=1 Tax=Streptomyces cadmiisoli TaxID=2184053 RepID=A0A2Z4IR87_9ACTN|nr:hypothetical protein DN051_01335 [Streptomyces cadmiisoli]
MNAILYADRTCVLRRYLPHDFPLWEAVYDYFAKWQKEVAFAEPNGSAAGTGAAKGGPKREAVSLLDRRAERGASAGWSPSGTAPAPPAPAGPHHPHPRSASVDALAVRCGVALPGPACTGHVISWPRPDRRP